MNRIPLSGDVVERPIAYAGNDRVARALATDPALRSLPSPELARRLGTTRAHVENAIHGLVVHHTGHRLQVSGRSFDEAISDAGAARRAALSPEPLNEAAGFGAPGGLVVRRGAGQGIAEHGARRALVTLERPAPALSPYFRTRTGRRAYGFDARGYQTPPVPDLSCILLSDAFPVTKRQWSQGDTPTADEVAILNWQHPLVTGAQSPQSKATLKAISAGCRSWDTPANVAGNQLSPRSADERGKWWLELQQIMSSVSSHNVVGANSQVTTSEIFGGPYNVTNPMGSWGLVPPVVSKDQVNLQYWDLSDASHPRMKMAMWMSKALLTLGSSSSIIDATYAKEGAHWQIEIRDGVAKIAWNPESDWEKASMQLFAGLGGIISGLTSAVAAAVSVYCPACSVAIKIAGNLATNAANGAVTTKALASYGDQMLTDAAVRAAQGDAGALIGLRAFAATLIGLSPNATAGTTPSGGLVYDYLSTLGTAPGGFNVAAALETYATDHTNKIYNAATLATAAQVPFLDAQYAVAAMTDTLSRFAANVSTIYFDPSLTLAERALLGHSASRNNPYNRTMHRLPVPGSLANLPLVQNPKAAPISATTVAVAAVAVGAAWKFGLLKGLL